MQSDGLMSGASELVGGASKRSLSIEVGLVTATNKVSFYSLVLLLYCFFYYYYYYKMA